MGKLLSQARTRLGTAVLAAATITLGGAATAVAVTSPATREVSDESVFSTEPAPTTAAPAETSEAPEPQVVAGTTQAPGSTEGSPPAATVDGVTTTQAPEPETVDPPAEGQSMDGVGTTGEDGYYTPAPPRINPGEPPVAPPPPPPPADDEPQMPPFARG